MHLALFGTVLQFYLQETVNCWWWIMQPLKTWILHRSDGRQSMEMCRVLSPLLWRDRVDNHCCQCQRGSPINTWSDDIIRMLQTRERNRGGSRGKFRLRGYSVATMHWEQSQSFWLLVKRNRQYLQSQWTPKADTLRNTQHQNSVLLRSDNKAAWPKDGRRSWWKWTPAERTRCKAPRPTATRFNSSQWFQINLHL